MAEPAIVRVLMVCLGNICRSPTAEATLRHQVQLAGLEHHVEIDSAGTSDWHKGETPDPRSMRHAARRRYDLSTQRSRPVTPRDFHHFDFLLAMDEQNLRDLRRLSPPEPRATVELFLGEEGVRGYREVPDPYEGGEAGFELVLDLCEEASERLVRRFQAMLAADRRRG